MVTSRAASAVDRSPEINALAAVLMIGNSALWSFLAVVVIRMPYSGLIWLMGPVLCTIGALGEPDRGRRTEALFCNLVTMGLLQFGFAALRNIPPLIVAAVPLAVLVTGCRDTGNNAGATICASLLDIANGNVSVAAETLFLTFVLAVALPLSNRVLERLFFGRDEWSGLGSKPPLRLDALIRRMAAFAAAFALMYALEWQYGHWIPLTVALSYSGGDTAAGLRGNFKSRLRGAAFGLAASLLWLGTACYVDYRFSYFAAVILPLAFYYSIRTGDHTGFCIMYMMICGTLNDLIRGSSPLYGNGWQLFFQATAGIAIGAGIVELVKIGAASENPDQTSRKSTTLSCGVLRPM